MKNVFARMGPQLSLWFCLTFCSTVAFAVPETFQGLLIPASFDPPIPITVTVEYSYGKVLGRVKTSLPLVGEGPITSGEKERSYCILTSHIGSGVRLRLEGSCMAAKFEGKYRIYFADGRRVDGTFRLHSATSDKPKKALTESGHSDPFASTTARCLKANSTCLAGCPRGEQSHELFCANTCTRKLAVCKRKVKQSLEYPSMP